MNKRNMRRNMRGLSGSNAGNSGMSRRRFLGTSAGVGAAAVSASAFGRGSLSRAVTVALPHATVGLNSEYAFEVLAVQYIGEPDPNQDPPPTPADYYKFKEDAINLAIDMLQEKIATLSDVSIVKSEPPIEGLEYGYMDYDPAYDPNDPDDAIPGDEFYYGRGGFVWRDYNLDNQIDYFQELESGKAVTVSFPADAGLLKAAGPEFALMLPWTVSVYSGTNPMDQSDVSHDHIYVVAQVPETFVRLFMRDAVNYQGWMGVAKSCHKRIRDLVRDTFSGFPGWTTDVNMGLALMDETTINSLEGILKVIFEQPDYQLNLDTASHRGEVGPLNTPLPADPLTPITVDNVINKLVESIIAGPALLQTDDDPPLGYDEPMHHAFFNFINQMCIFEDYCEYCDGYCCDYGTEFSYNNLAAIIGCWGSQAWPEGKTILKFTGVRVLDFRTGSMNLKLIEMCQPFYGHTALGLGFHHAPSLPDTLAVWEENGSVWLAGIDITFLFPYFFNDVIQTLECYDPGSTHPLHYLCPGLNALAPTLNNEVGTIVNRAVGKVLFPVG